MKKFFKDVLSENSAASSKRLIAIFVVINLLAMTWVSVIRADDGIPPEFMFNALALVAAGGLGLTSAERIFGKRSEPVVEAAPEPEPEAYGGRMADNENVCPNCGCNNYRQRAEAT